MSLIIRKKSGVTIRKNNQHRLIIDDDHGVDKWFNELIVKSVIADVYKLTDDQASQIIEDVNYICVWTRNSRTLEKTAKKCALVVSGGQIKYVPQELIESCGLKTYDELVACFEIAGIKKKSGVSFFHANYRS